MAEPGSKEFVEAVVRMLQGVRDKRLSQARECLQLSGLLGRAAQQLLEQYSEIDRLKGCMRQVAADLEEGGSAEDAAESLLYAAEQTPATLAAMQQDSGVSFEEFLGGLPDDEGED